MSTSIATTTKTEDLHEDKSSRYHQLVQKKASLEKKLNEKYEQLHQLCQKEASLIGNNLDLIIPNTSLNSSQQPPANRKVLHQNEISKLLMEKQKQQQMSQNSLSIINDPMQSKSIRRTHKQAYEMSLQKIEQLNENINLLQKHEYPMKAQDDIDLHRSDNRYMKNALAMVGNNSRNLHMLNTQNSMSMSERRNSMKSTTSSLGSSNTFIIQSSPSSATSLTSLKTIPNMAHSPRTRQDGRYEFEIHKGDSPTPSAMSMQHPPTQNINHQIPLCSQSLKNIKINTENHSPNIPSHYGLHAQYSPQQKHFVQNHLMFQQQAQPQQHSPHYATQSRAMPQSDHKFLQRLHSFNHQMQHEKGYLLVNTMQSDDIRVKTQPKYQASPNHYTVSHSAGLGGYWTMNEHNHRVWVADNKYPLSPPNAPQHSMAKKSNSLGNFDFMHKIEDTPQPDAVSVSSGNSNDHKKKEKIWCETSLDSPTEIRRRPKVESPTPSSYSTTDYINNNHVYESAPSISNAPPSRHLPLPLQNQYPSNVKLHSPPENGIYHNPLANVPNLPPKSKLRYSESTRSTMSNRDFENNIVNSLNSPVQQHLTSFQPDSPLNVTIIQEGSWKPYKEEVKSYELSDFYKYSEKYRQKQQHQQQ